MADVLVGTEDKMKKAVDAFRKSMSGVRTGRASPALVEGIVVEYYGTQTPLKQIANISVPDARSLVIQPFDKSAMPEIEKAIMKSDLGITPKTESGLVRLNMPSLTEERRKDLVKLIKKNGEEARIVLRNIRRDGIDALKKDDAMTEDVKKKQEDQIQKLVKKYTDTIDQILADKEKEVMEV